MHPLRKRRLILIIIMVVGVATATGFALVAFNQNMMFFFTPSDVQAGKAPENRLFRMGGIVVDGSVKKSDTSTDVWFDITDNEKAVTVKYSGILPDLFREGQGIITKGKLNANGEFIAEEVLAKHDENYMPPEVAATMKKKMPTSIKE
ncbi:Cytochrome c-type biogenesis protein CcmE, heme chaperone [hydrothermal vent metagenome]|uniref:Cytochrome c-type biogenesis protein CcmE, heme chaperone n=1 Tax=hydrothermal vent metagenome TaxID=652676 RepID=A0A3B0ZWV7_9ZZZZ